MKFLLLALIIFFLSTGIYAQVFVNPGIKLGYAFGKEGGFVFGWEISVTFLGDYMIWGIVADYDTIKDLNRFHLGIECSRAGIGLDVGPSFAWENEKSYAGFSIIPYGGLLVYPYYNYSYFWKRGSIHEIGSYFKLTFVKVKNVSIQ